MIRLQVSLSHSEADALARLQRLSSRLAAPSPLSLDV